MDAINNIFKPLDDEEDEKKADCLKDEENRDGKMSNLDKLFDKLCPNDHSFVREEVDIKNSKPEISDSISDFYKNFFMKSPIDFSWKKANNKGDLMGNDLDIDYVNIFEDVGKLAHVEKQLQLLYRPFTCVMDVSCRFNMYELCLLLIDSRYDPGSHPSVSVKVTHPSALVKITPGGKIVATALSVDSARRALFKVVRILQNLDYKADVNNFSKNIVNASFNMPFKLDLELMIRRHPEEVTHNRSKRPFITYTFEDLGVRFAIFPTGFVLVLHSSSHSETRSALGAFLPILARFKNGYPTLEEQQGLLVGDLTYKLVWERRLEEDKDGLLLYS
ncbi:uncharacterized protein LOC108147885 isoform X2 [Drosophila elegans]|uniref:uncharacterized protein LOC108147885 isoform X2 n=1 Tax=Drosophila elegans TaxID=30023 RepID=UPI0007E5C004|nr:uncharacterized protein LOC108147885 isoform X2 [Drosophila elegans]